MRSLHYVMRVQDVPLPAAPGSLRTTCDECGAHVWFQPQVCHDIGGAHAHVCNNCYELDPDYVDEREDS